METKLPMFLFSLMRHNAKAQNIGIWIIPLDKMDELLFSVCVVKTWNWCVSIGKMHKILQQGLNPEPANGVGADTGCWPGGNPSRAS